MIRILILSRFYFKLFSLTIYTFINIIVKNICFCVLLFVKAIYKTPVKFVKVMSESWIKSPQTTWLAVHSHVGLTGSHIFETFT